MAPFVWWTFTVKKKKSTLVRASIKMPYNVLLKMLRLNCEGQLLAWTDDFFIKLSVTSMYYSSRHTKNVSYNNTMHTKFLLWAVRKCTESPFKYNSTAHFFK